MANKGPAGNNLSGHNNSSGSVNLKDKITSKIRDCLSSAHRELCVMANGSSTGVAGDDEKACDVDDTVNEDMDSAEWHTPCDDMSTDENNQRAFTFTSPPNCGGPRVYRALFAYKPTRADELSFEPGDVVVLLQQTSERGWWYGEHQPSGKTGLFPVNYVEVFTKAQQKSEKSFSKKNVASPLSESRVHIRPGRLTALEQEIAALKTQVESKPSLEQVRFLEEAVDHLKLVTSAANSPAPIIISPGPICRETPVLNIVQSSTNSGKPSLTKAVTEAPPKNVAPGSSGKKPGPVRVPSCFIPKTPTGQVGQKTPTFQNSASKPFKPAGLISTLTNTSRVSTSPASLYAVAVRVNAVSTPSSSLGSPRRVVENLTRQEDELMEEIASTASERRAGLMAADKLKRRSITHYTKKCQKNFTKLCNFYERLAEDSRLGLVPEKTECSSTSPSSLSTTTALFEETSAFPSGSASDHSTFFVPKKVDGNRSKDNPFQNKSFDSTVETNKRFPVFNAVNGSAKQGDSISSVLLKQQKLLNKAATVSSAADNRAESPSLRNIRRPPMNKVKTSQGGGGIFSTLSTPQPVQQNNKARHARCSSATAVCGEVVEASGGSVNDLRRRFETISVSKSAAMTNALNSQPKEKRSRKSPEVTTTPTSSGRKRKTGKDSGLGEYPRQSQGGDSTVDLFNIAQTTQALEDSTTSSASPAFSATLNEKNVTLKVLEKEGQKGASNNNDSEKLSGEIRCSSSSMLNEAGIFDCSLTWTESSSDSADILGTLTKAKNAPANKGDAFVKA